MVILPMTLDDP